ncbi:MULTISPECIES: hypothetical protein [Pandoraea]|jgi:hypothetical protein|nr:MULTISPECIES: hypothetical protein [Pandoraea]MBN9094661.1 hypothetical protein [Pandoraea pnomenusa]
MPDSPISFIATVRRYLSQSPAGGAMMVALLIALANFVALQDQNPRKRSTESNAQFWW